MKATESETKQLHDKVVFSIIKGKQLTKIQKRETTQVLMFMKQKRCEKKGHAVSEGWKQITILNKSDVTSPTAATQSVLITAEIYAIENMDVDVIYALREFLTADMGK